MQALARELLRRRKESAPADVIEEAESNLVAFLLDAIRFDMQSGFTEEAVARIQAVLEFNLFAPELPVGKHSRGLWVFSSKPSQHWKGHDVLLLLGQVWVKPCRQPRETCQLIDSGVVF